MAERMKGLRCQRVQVDEIWTFCQKKQARLTFEERHALNLGDQYVFVGIDADSKLIPHFEVGKRNMVTAYSFMDTLKARLMRGTRFQLTTDAFVPYIGAVERAWGAEAPDFAQLVKVFAGVTLEWAGTPRRRLRRLSQQSCMASRTRRSCLRAISNARTSRFGWRVAGSPG